MNSCFSLPSTVTTNEVLSLARSSPLNLAVNRIANAIIHRVQTHHSPRPANRPVCSLTPSSSPSVCDANPAICTWLSALASSVVPPANARARDIDNPLDSLLQDIVDQDNPSTDGRRHQPVPATAYPAADRVIAIGDIHGDVNALRKALRSASVIDQNDAWVGGRTVLVQVGDQLDRGERERDIYSLLFRLQDSAPSSGGAVHILLGNHELMNASLDFRYVTRGGFDDFSQAITKGPKGDDPHFVRRRPTSRITTQDARTIRQLPAEMRARAKAIVAGGDLAAELAERAAVSVIVGDTLFVHAGLAPRHLRTEDFGQKKESDNEAFIAPKSESDSVSEALRMIDVLNVQTRRFLRGEGPLPTVLRRGDGPVWMRDYSRPDVRAGSSACKMLSNTLRMAGVKRMVVGHTPQSQGINSACGGKVWRVDTGMSKAYGGVPEAIEVGKRGVIRIHTQKGVVQGSARCN